jgi:hypothetical protein
MGKPEGRRRELARRWRAADARAALAAASASGLSLREFARREGIHPQRLYWWRGRLAGDARMAVPTFIELKPGGLGGVPRLVEVVLRSGRVLRVPESIDTATIQRFVAALE